MFQNAYKGKRVLVTGHTGFKGTWLCWWLLRLGAEVTGFALDPPTFPSIFEQTGLSPSVHDLRGDVRDTLRVLGLVTGGRFDFIFHLAAQPLVLDSYSAPAQTFAVNVDGTRNLLEAVRRVGAACVLVVVSTDKVYENRELGEPFREEDKLGGFDPYSASKAAMEIVVASYRDAFFGANHGIFVATARAGNVIGGGDWQKHRIIPDVVRALAAGKETEVRNPQSLRPWQHALEPLSGYLELAARMGSAGGQNGLCSAWNFGPAQQAACAVGDLATRAIAAWPGERRPWVTPPDAAPARHEAMTLRLSTEKARQQLQWFPVWDLERAIERTMAWYWAVHNDVAAAARQTADDIAAYEQAALERELGWAR